MIKKLLIENIEDFEKGKFDVNIINFPILLNDITIPFNEAHLNKNTIKVLHKILLKAVDGLKENGLLFLYGSPLQLIKSFEIIKDKMKFRHWMSIDILDSIENTYTDHLKHNHLGILMLTKGEKYLISTASARTPHIGCTACGKNIKDWGGKKHLMNNNGTGISDVWRNFFKVIRTETDPDNNSIRLNFIDGSKLSFEFDKDEIGDPIVNKILSLVDQNNSSIVIYKISKKLLKPINNNLTKKVSPDSFRDKDIKDSLKNKIILGDCISELERLSRKYPEGIFDLVFADPPYNLSKEYKAYDDTLAEKEYLKWCDRWLELCLKLTKPSGSILILNIPKWAIEHAKTLNKIAYLQNWIIWEALSTPKGKIMPAHYSLLYYTKSPNNYVFNFPGYVDGPEYCLRANCIKSRKKFQQDSLFSETKELSSLPVSDIWSDIHRIKHKKDRDDHPCQLPLKLMNRIIQTFSNKGDLVFDPFGGVGTTGISALKNERYYLLMEIDSYYKNISEKWISEVEKTGGKIRKRERKINGSKYTKKFLEIKVQELSNLFARKPTLEEFVKHFKLDIEELKKIYPEPKTVLKAGRIGILNLKK